MQNLRTRVQTWLDLGRNLGDGPWEFDATPAGIITVVTDGLDAVEIITTNGEVEVGDDAPLPTWV